MIDRPLSHNLTINPRNLTIKARNYVKSAASARRGRLYALGSERRRIEKVKPDKHRPGCRAKAAARIADRQRNGRAARRSAAPLRPDHSAGKFHGRFLGRSFLYGYGHLVASFRALFGRQADIAARRRNSVAPSLAQESTRFSGNRPVSMKTA